MTKPSDKAENETVNYDTTFPIDDYRRYYIYDDQMEGGTKKQFEAFIE
jgi:hypothetical protein